MPSRLVTQTADGTVTSVRFVDDNGSEISQAVFDQYRLTAADLLAKARTALTTNATFLAVASPTNAQLVAQAKALTKQNTALIKLLAGLVMGATDLLQDETGT